MACNINTINVDKFSLRFKNYNGLVATVDWDMDEVNMG